MVAIGRILSRPTVKPYRTADLKHEEHPYLNENGHVDFSPGDIENPHNWSTARRWYVTVVSVLLVVNATFASSSPSGCFGSISEEFGVSQEAAGLTITLFLLGYCAGPLVFAPLSEVRNLTPFEFWGRRWIFYITFLLYLAFNFLCTFAPNFGSLLVGRFLTGTFISAPLSNAPGVLADLWGPVERGNAMAVFSCKVWVGPALGPVVAGFLEMTENWRWSFYVLLWLGGGTAIIMFTIPETFGPMILATRARRIRKAKIPGYENVKAPVEDSGRSIWGVYKVALTRPGILLFDLISFLCAVYMSVVYCLLYMLFSIYPIVFQERRGWGPGVGELPLIGTAAKKIESGHPLKPEDRLTLAMVGGVGFAITSTYGLCSFAFVFPWEPLTFAWTAEYNWMHWAVPTVAGVFLAMSLMLIFVGFLNYLVDTFLMYAASAIAVNTVTRSACGAAAPLFTNYMFQALGIGGEGSLIGGVAAVLAIIPFTFYTYGEGIRKRSKFAPTQDHRADDEEQQRRSSEGPAAGGSSSASSRTVGVDDVPEPHAEKQREAADDDLQNALGESKDENVHFGQEAR
ncbi:Uu.00g025020.m01.CDS01 [Anthostomella pinea]|uniref:Uu.00g025020.m01.CDS01 n=1 Tax=Anthostomella pinea TaxID=933095 RepID=A0AAI8YA25_9PEZI|nr:Uu.00g025020.m01.CDS01 [Anthostomella pinea]